MEHLDKHAVMFKSATEVYDTTSAIGRFFNTLLVAAIAQWERENLGERVKMGMKKNFRKGGWNGGEPPYGYHLEDGKLIVYEPEAAIVRRTFEMYKKHGHRYISKVFNREGLRTRDGALWAEYTIRYILDNPVYSGKIRWNYRHLGGKKNGQEIIIDGEHESIISIEEQEAVPSIAKRRLLTREKTHVCFPFTWLLRCSRCGNTINGGEKKQKLQNYRFYGCRGRFSLGVCDLPIISEDTIEKLVLQKVDVIVSGSWKKDINFAREEMEVDTIDNSHLENELSEIQKRKKKWQMAFANEAISTEDLRQRMQEENDRETAIRNQLTSQVAPAKPVVKLTNQEVIDMARTMKENCGHPELEHKKLIMHTLFSEIVINSYGEAVDRPGRRVACEIKSFKTKKEADNHRLFSPINPKQTSALSKDLHTY
ncbi:recombinase family protein, partial [Brevibacillus porteri]|nr:recombinase family protein [Brevibacillus porteri]